MAIRQKAAPSIKDVDEEIGFEEAKRGASNTLGFIDATLSMEKGFGEIRGLLTDREC